MSLFLTRMPCAYSFGLTVSNSTGRSIESFRADTSRRMRPCLGFLVSPNCAPALPIAVVVRE